MELSDYAVAPLCDGDVSRCRGSGNGLMPILLVTARDASLASFNRLEHEYALKDELDSAWAARPVGLTRYDDRMTLVLEDPGGEPLDRLLSRQLTTSECLQIAISFARALVRMHERGLVHKDIRPANAFVDVSSGSVWLTGFGVASRIPRERPNPEPPEVIAGTLAYMAPEQTGRMNRSVDSRSDLYSFGITLYELLTGALPFMASDPIEWIHCHIARQPLPPCEREMAVPAQLSSIVMKLLAKTAEERYQTAASVEADLRQCLTEWELHGRIDSFPLGAHDASDRLVLPERLYGREREIETLLAAFDRVVAHGTPELVLVSGYSGVGKSSVVNELHKALVPPRGLFASGKFDQYKRDIPYATLAQAFQTLVRQILVKSEAEMSQWRHSLQEAVGPNGQLIVSLVPEVEFIIGKQPPVPNLPPRGAQNRFQRVFRRFLGAFARAEHPLALFLDDLQWMDTSTLELLEYLITDPNVRHVMLLGAYRDNEVTSSHPLMRTLGTIRRAGANMHEIVLAPLRLDDVGQLIADTLYCDRDAARPLAQLVHDKTGGNPFFAIQFLAALAEEGLLAFEPEAAAWTWDVTRIRAKGYTDNVVDLMVGRLKRLPDVAQDALRQLAFLGNVVEIATLTFVHGESEESIHTALWDATRAGLILRLGDSYAFLHDRIQQAAYSLIPEERRAGVHLRIGRILLASMTPDGLEEHLFDVANQLNRGAALLCYRDEKAQVATIDLRAGRKAKVSAAYASACAYLAAGIALLDERDWDSQYDVMFSLHLERAECAFLSGNFAEAEHLIAELLHRGVSKVDQAAVYDLKILLHIVKSETAQAIASAHTCLRLFGIDIPAQPSQEQVEAEYQTVLRNLDGRSIESLIDLPLMTDPELQAATVVLSALVPAAYFTDRNLCCWLVCRIVNVSLTSGTNGACANVYGNYGTLAGPVFHSYREGFRFTKLACDLVEKHGFIAYRAKTHFLMGTAAFWTGPIASAIEFHRTAIRAATETGDLTYGCYSMLQSVYGLLLQNAPLDAVWRESEKNLDFARNAKFRDVADSVVSQQRFIATMQGRTTTFSTFSDERFDETAFEAQLTEGRLPTIVCMHWILKLKARFIAGDYTEALAAADKAKAVLWATAPIIYVLDYYYYAALTVAALYENGHAREQAMWRDLLTAHREQLREWAENYPPTFAGKHALVSAELARLKGRDVDAMHLYEQAIQSARESIFVQDEGLAREVAARFYASRGFETISRAYLRRVRSCYLRWGALGKVRQLDQRYPRLGEEPAASPLTATIDAPVEQLDVATVIKASQAVSGEIELGKVIEILMRIAVEHVGAERGLLILFPNDEARISAEAATVRGTVEVTLRQAAVTPSELPASVLHYVIRTRQSVILDDAATPTLFSADAYVQEVRPRSVLCVPLIKQTTLVGALYLENTLTPRVFTAGRIAVLELLASQAAISLENATLYSDLQRSESFLAEGQRISHTGSWSWNASTGERTWSDETFRILGYGPDVSPTLEMLLARVHPDDVPLVQRQTERASSEEKGFDFEHRLLLPDGSVKYVHLVVHGIRNEAGQLEFTGTVMDVTAAKRAEEALRNAQAELANVTRVTTLGELAASIAHEVNQPLTAVVSNAEACRRWLNRSTPNLDEARSAVESIIKNGHRAGEVTRRVRALLNSTDTQKTPLDINDVVNEAISLVQHELASSRVSMRTEIADALPLVNGDRIQLQQVIINLVINGIEAMQPITARPRELVIRTQQDEAHHVLVAVTDCGVGLAAENADQLFNAFFTTKSSGMGIGLSICRSIIDAHGGRLLAAGNAGPGATFQFVLPPYGHVAS